METTVERIGESCFRISMWSLFLIGIKASVLLFLFKKKILFYSDSREELKLVSQVLWFLDRQG